MSQVYTPTHTLKKYGDNIWVVDGAIIRFYGLPFTTRMVVIKLKNNELLIYSPIDLTHQLKKELDQLGTVKHLISPNKIHYWYISDFQEVYPDAITYASDGVESRAKKAGKNIRWDIHMNSIPANAFEGVEIIPLKGNSFMTEYTLFHYESQSWVVTDIIENFEPHKINPFFQLIAFLGGALHPHGGTTYDQRLLYKGNHDLLRTAINRIKTLHPTQIIMSHGAIIHKNVAAELERIFNWV